MKVQIGERYASYMSFYDGKQFIKMHAECYEASQHLDELEFDFGANARGCTCEHGDDTCGKKITCLTYHPSPEQSAESCTLLVEASVLKPSESTSCMPALVNSLPPSPAT